MKSIAGKLLLGLVVSGIIGGAVLAVLVTYQYGLLSKNPPPLSRTIQEITEHVLIPVGVFLFLFGTGALLVIRRVEAQLKSTARDVCQAARAANRAQAVHGRRQRTYSKAGSACTAAGSVRGRCCA